MPMRLYDEDSVIDIAQAVRNIKADEGKYKIGEMSQEIYNIVQPYIHDIDVGHGGSFVQRNAEAPMIDYTLRGRTDLSANMGSTYKEVEYLESDGNVYINTNYIPKSNTRIVIRNFYKDWTSAFDGESFIGSQSSVGSLDTALLFNITDIQNSGYCADWSDEKAVSNLKQSLEYETIEIDSDYLKIGNNSYAFNEFSLTNPSYPLFLFAKNCGGTATNNAICRIGRVTIYEGEEIKKDLFPVKKSSQYGFLDVESNSFIAASGTGTFTQGALSPTPLAPYKAIMGDKKTKNLFKYANTEFNANGINAKVFADGSLRIRGTATARTDIKLCEYSYLKENLQPNQYYTLNGFTNGSQSTYRLTWNNVGYQDNVPIIKKWTISNVDKSIFLTVKEGVTFDDLFIYPQLELGTTLSEFEPYGYVIDLYESIDGCDLCEYLESNGQSSYILNYGTGISEGYIDLDFQVVDSRPDSFDKYFGCSNDVTIDKRVLLYKSGEYLIDELGETQERYPLYERYTVSKKHFCTSEPLTHNFAIFNSTLGTGGVNPSVGGMMKLYKLNIYDSQGNMVVSLFPAFRNYPRFYDYINKTETTRFNEDNFTYKIAYKHIYLNEPFFQHPFDAGEYDSINFLTQKLKKKIHKQKLTTISQTNNFVNGYTFDMDAIPVNTYIWSPYYEKTSTIPATAENRTNKVFRSSVNNLIGLGASTVAPIANPNGVPTQAEIQKMQEYLNKVGGIDVYYLVDEYEADVIAPNFMLLKGNTDTSIESDQISRIVLDYILDMPKGNKSITANGTVNVYRYENAVVNVPVPSDTTAVASDITLGKTAYCGGSKITGTRQSEVSGTLDITSNGNYDVEMYKYANVTVGGSGNYKMLDINIPSTVTSYTTLVTGDTDIASHYDSDDFKMVLIYNDNGTLTTNIFNACIGNTASNGAYGYGVYTSGTSLKVSKISSAAKTTTTAVGKMNANSSGNVTIKCSALISLLAGNYKLFITW